jgi:ABC-2 type transport system permease protein
MSAVVATFLRNWRVNLRVYPWDFFIGSLLTAMVTVALAVFTFRTIGGGRVSAEFSEATGTSDFVTYIVVGAALYAFTVRMMLWVSRALVAEHREGTLESLLIAPAGRPGYLLGVAAHATTVTLAEIVVMIAATAPLGAKVQGLRSASLIFTVPVLVLAVLGMAAVLAVVMLATGDTYLTQNTLFLTLAVLGGFTFPVQSLPAPFELLAQLFPLTHAIEVFRSALQSDRPWAELAPHTAWAVLLGTAFLVAGLRLLPRAERRALEGRR